MNPKKQFLKLTLLLFSSLCLLTLSLSLLSSPTINAKMAIGQPIYKPFALTETVIITESGFSPSNLTITVNSSVRWQNQTEISQTLNECISSPQQYSIYLPLIFKAGTGLAFNQYNLTAPFSVTLATGEAYNHTFDTIGTFGYCLSGLNGIINTIQVIQPLLPDLVIESLVITPSNLILERHFDLELTIKNQGFISVTTPFTISWYLNGPVRLQYQTLVTDFQVGTLSNPVLTNRLQLTQTGLYTFYAIVDATNVIPEKNELNNTSVSITKTVLALTPHDIVFVVDKSGSMQFMPTCYGCFERTELPNPNDNPPYWTYTNYPANGVIYPLGYDSSFTATTELACTTQGDSEFEVDQTVFTQNSFNHIIIEAELASINDTPPQKETSLQPARQGYWALQRGESNYDNNTFIPSQGTSIDGKGAHMTHHPSLTDFDGVIYGKHYTWADAQAREAPGLHYKFHFYDGLSNEWAENFYIWIRVHAGKGLDYATGGTGRGDNHPDGSDEAYWQISNINPDFPYTLNQAGTVERFEVSEVQNGTSGGNRNYWRWVRLNPADSLTNLTNTTNTFEFTFYAGSTGYSIDRIVITDNPDTTGSMNSLEPGGNGSALDYGDDSQDARLVPVTMDSAHWLACDICNPIFGQNITDPSVCRYYSLNNPQNNQTHPLFDDWEMPLRSVKESIKETMLVPFPEIDQIGLVTYNSTNTEKFELACKRASVTQGAYCATGTVGDIDYHKIRKVLEDTNSTGLTPMAEGLKAGLEVLGLDPGEIGIDVACSGNTNSSCVQGNSQKTIILITDGAPTKTFGNSTDYGYNCTSSNSPVWANNNIANYRCPLYFAQEAGANGVKVHVIAVGYGTDQSYLAELAILGNGNLYISPSAQDIPFLIKYILNR